MTIESVTPFEYDEAFALQDRFVRGFPWLRKKAGMTQRDLASAAGWKQPYVDRLEDARSPLLGALARVERYARACGFTTVVVFVDKQTDAVARTLPLGEAGAAAAERLLAGGAGTAMVRPGYPARLATGAVRPGLSSS